MSTLNQKSYLERLDWVLILLYFILVFIGLLSIYSVEHTGQASVFFKMDKNYMKQILFLGIGLFVSFIILLSDSKLFPNMAFLSYFAGIILLLLVLVIGRNVNGSRSFLVLGPIQIQPAEMVKFFTALALAKFLSDIENNFSALKQRLIAASFAILPMMIIILQKETGLALVYLAFFLAMYREGLPTWIIIVGFSIIALTLTTLLVDKTKLLIILTVVAILFIFFQYRQKRRNRNAIRIAVVSWFVCVLFSQVMVPFAFTKILKSYQVQRIYTTIGQNVPLAYAQGVDIEKETASEYNVKQSKIDRKSVV